MNKVLMLGLDGVSWELIREWIAKKELPFIKKAMEKGLYATNWTTIPCLTSPALPSFITGKNPAKTGIFGFRKSDGSLMSYQDIKDPAFWDLFENPKIESLVVNLRINYPPKIRNGVMVAGTITPSEESEYVYPARYKKYFKGVHVEYDKGIKNQGTQEISKRYTDITKKKFKKFEGFFFKKKFRFALFWFDLTDNIQHFAWNNNEVILEYFKNIESIIKEFVKRTPDYNIILFSDHGFEPVPKYIVYINEWLERKGHLRVEGEGFAKLKNKVLPSLYSKAYTSGGWMLYKLLPLKIYNRLFKLKKKIEKNSIEKESKAVVMEETITALSGLDMKRTKAFLDQKWGIKIIKKNVKNPKKFRDRLIKELRNLKSPNGKRVFKQVYKREEVFKGKYLKEVPDIVFLTQKEFELRDGFSRRLFKRIRVKRDVVGCHENARDGIFIAYGKDIAKKGKIKDISIYDLAPTVLHLMNSGVPQDMDGRVLDIFKKTSEPGKRKPRQVKEDVKSIIDKIEI